VRASVTYPTGQRGFTLPTTPACRYWNARVAGRRLTKPGAPPLRQGHDALGEGSAGVGHVSLDQLKVMSAVERCRRMALGGHVARCENCADTVIAYNSCRKLRTARLGRAIPCSDPRQQRHKIIRKRLALLRDESVSVVTGGTEPAQSRRTTHAHLHYWQ
jgi:Transposase zinc-binding domain